ncbi:50S ribosomal protein L18, partial [Nanoarchaeota archaeon]
VIIATANSKDVEKMGWKFNKKNIPCAYLVGYLIGKRAIEKKASEAILDIGLQTSIKGSRLYSVVKGAIDSGLNVACSEEALPNEERIKGKHICGYRKINEQEFSKNFEEALAKIKGGK